jgi:hypothetical protein
VNQFAENDRKNSGMATASCTTTMRMPAQISHLVQQSLAEHGTAQLQQPPYQISHRVTSSYSQGLRKF